MLHIFMEKKNERILELELPSKIYFFILIYYKKQPITPYRIGKLIYKTFNTVVSPKIYSYIKTLKNLGLIEFEEQTIKGRRAKILKPNLIKFFEILNKFKLPEDYKLKNEEIKTLAEWFEKYVDFEKATNYSPQNLLPLAEDIRKGLGELNILDQVAIFLKAGVLLTKKLRASNMKTEEMLKIVKENLSDLYPPLEIYQPFILLPESISEKLEHLIVHPYIENLLILAQLLSRYISDFISSLTKTK